MIALNDLGNVEELESGKKRYACAIAADDGAAPRIWKGDAVIMKSAAAVEDGDIVAVATDDGAVVCRRFCRQEFTAPRVLGRVVEVRAALN